MTFTFEGAPRGTELDVGTYYESAMRFAAIAPGRVLLSGGGIPGYPDDGTGYLEIPDGYPGVGGLSFGPTNTFPTLAPFNLVSFDGAVYDGEGPKTLEFVGYKPMAGTVTNYFTVDFQFQTFYLDSSFTDLFRVDVLNASWSLDNLVISEVPEPSCGALAVLATLCGLGRRWMTGRRKQRIRRAERTTPPGFTRKAPKEGTRC